MGKIGQFVGEVRLDTAEGCYSPLCLAVSAVRSVSRPYSKSSAMKLLCVSEELEKLGPLATV